MPDFATAARAARSSGYAAIRSHARSTAAFSQSGGGPATTLTAKSTSPGRTIRSP